MAFLLGEWYNIFMFDLESVIKTGGYIGLFAMVFAESGLLVGFFLPGDSLLFTAGILASQGFLDISLLIVLLFIAAVAGDNVGYVIGRKAGPKLFTKEKSLLFRQDYLIAAEKYYSDHGGKTVILARFIPVIRAFAPVVAGIGRMKYRTFLAYDIVGGLLWAVGITLLGYFLGNAIPNVDRYLLPIIALIIILSIAPPAIKILKSHRSKSAPGEIGQDEPQSENNKKID